MSTPRRRLCSSVSSDEEGGGVPGCSTMEDDAYQGDNEDDNCISEASSCDDEGKLPAVVSSHSISVKNSKSGTGSDKSHSSEMERQGTEKTSVTTTAEIHSPPADADRFEIKMSVTERERISSIECDENENSQEGHVVMKKIYRSASLECSESIGEVVKPPQRRTSRSMSVQFSKPPIKKHRNSTSVSQPDDFDFDFFDDEDDMMTGSPSVQSHTVSFLGVYDDDVSGDIEDTSVGRDLMTGNDQEPERIESGVEEGNDVDDEEMDAHSRRSLYSSQTSGYKTSSQDKTNVETVDEVFFKEGEFSGVRENKSVTENKLLLSSEGPVAPDKEGAPRVEYPPNQHVDQGIIPACVPARDQSDSSLDSTEEKWRSFGYDSLRVTKPVAPPTVLDNFQLSESEDSWRQYNEQSSLSASEGRLGDIVELQEDHSPGNIPLLDFGKCSLEPRSEKSSLNADALKELPNAAHDVEGWISPEGNASKVAVLLPGDEMRHDVRRREEVRHLKSSPPSIHVGSDERCTCRTPTAQHTSAQQKGPKSCQCSDGTQCKSTMSQPGAPATEQKAAATPVDNPNTISSTDQQPLESSATPMTKTSQMNSKQQDEHHANRTEKFQMEACKQSAGGLKDPSVVFEPLAGMYGGMQKTRNMDRGFIRKSKGSSGDVVGEEETFDINESVDLVDINELISGLGIRDLTMQISIATSCWDGDHCTECQEGREILYHLEQSFTDQSRMHPRARGKVFECLVNHSEDCLETYCCMPFCSFLKAHSDDGTEPNFEALMRHYRLGPAVFTEQTEMLNIEKFHMLCCNSKVDLREGLDWLPVTNLGKFGVNNEALAQLTEDGHKKLNQIFGNPYDNQWVVRKCWYRGDQHDELLRTVGKCGVCPYITAHLWSLQQDKMFYICREFNSGFSLADCLQAGPVQPQMVLNLFNQLLSAARFLHQRNIVFLLWIGSAIELNVFRDTLKLSNFSSARCLGEEDLEDITLYVPPKVTPPEFLCDPLPTLQIENDSWGLGHLLFEMVTGRSYFHKLRHKSSERFRKDLPKLWDHVSVLDVPDTVGNYLHLLTSCWQIDPGQRQPVKELMHRVGQIFGKGSLTQQKQTVILPQS